MLDNITIPSDQYGRYYTSTNLIKEIAKLKKITKISILDVGGYKGETHRFFDKDEADITVLDLYDSRAKNYIKGSALAMPFADNSFDFVVSFEVFEHIPRDERDVFIEECNRVSREAFVITAPFSGDKNEVLYSEERVNGLWKYMHKQNHPWLTEHIQYVTPKQAELENILEKKALHYKSVGDNELLLWNLMISFNYLTTLFRPNGLNPDIQEFYNLNKKHIESNSSVYYRHIYCISRDEHVIKKLSDQRPLDARIDPKDRQKIVADLINKIFIQISRDVRLKEKQHKQETARLSNDLEARIKMYDALKTEYDEINSQAKKPIPAPIAKKLMRRR